MEINLPFQTNSLVFFCAGGQQKVELGTVNLEEHFEDGVINVSRALTSRSRFIYPKVGKPATLDGLLARRLALRSQEEKDLANKVGKVYGRQAAKSY